VATTEFDLTLPGGRTLHNYDTGPDCHGTGPAELTVVWQHGTPQTGPPPEPLIALAGVRWLSADRPGYGGSTPRPGRSVADVAADTAALADAAGVGRFAVLGASGGGPHALACAAVLPDRVTGVVSIAGVAPFDASGLDWFAGMAAGGAAEFRAAAAGPDALRALLERAGEPAPDLFAPPDLAALAGPYGPWLIATAQDALATGRAGYVDDDLAFVAPWGFRPADVVAPVLLVHGGLDRLAPSAHSAWLAAHLPTAELDLRPGDGHLSIFTVAESAVDRLRRGPGR
jgi:pimeloyl-ACP methyl ester carboxylesterase